MDTMCSIEFVFSVDLFGMRGLVPWGQFQVRHQRLPCGGAGIRVGTTAVLNMVVKQVSWSTCWGDGVFCVCVGFGVYGIPCTGEGRQCTVLRAPAPPTGRIKVR